jgi:hypothetical protein
MSKTIILVHGRSWKPKQADLEPIWIEALRAGIERDHPQKLEAFDDATLSFVYYGDLSNKILKSKGKTPPPNSTNARKQALEELKQVSPNGFTKNAYKKVPGKESFKEGVADTLAPILGFFHLTDNLVEQVAPDMRDYWNHDSAFGSASRARMTPHLKAAFDRGDSVCVIGHSLGTMICYDTLWKFSRSYDFAKYNKKKIDLFISTGSPLGDETVKRNLKGSEASKERRYPSNIKNWLNVAAEDDYISHDQKIAGDFRNMKKLGLVKAITDKRIYNLSYPNGKSNPHHSSGYLIHPEVTKAVCGWL